MSRECAGHLVLREQRVDHRFPQQHAIGHVLDAGVWRGGVLKPNAVAHLIKAWPCGQLLGVLDGGNQAHKDRIGNLIPDTNFRTYL
eukprot:1158663-Pelagomonas_calceolata.AAC.2